MSIDAEEFERHKKPLRYIIPFLKKNRTKAFTAKFIAQEVGINEREVRTAISWETLAAMLDRTYKSQIESVNIRGISYYKYKS